MSATIPTEFPVQSFTSASDFDVFLHREHASAPGLYLKLAKKASGIPSISSAEAIEVALCYGWIDGRANRLDDDWWLVRYTPRRSKSIWSQKNVQTVQGLIEEGRMRPAGAAVVAAAQLDGRWDRAYAGPATMEPPADFEAALVAVPEAASFFAGLNRSDRYSVLWRIETASPTSRANRIETLVKLLTEGKTPQAPATKLKEPPKPGRVTKATAPSKKATLQKQVSNAVTPSDQRRTASRRNGLRPLPG